MMGSTLLQRFIPWRSMSLAVFVGFSFRPLVPTRQPVIDASPRPFFVPRDPSTGEEIPGPPLPRRLAEPLGALNKLSDAECLQLYQEIQAQPPTKEVAAALCEIFMDFARSERHISLSRLVSISDRTFIREMCYDGASLASAWEKSKPEEIARWLADQGAQFLRADEASRMIGYPIYLWGDKDARAASEFAVRVPLAAYSPPGWDPNTLLYWYLRIVVRRRSTGDLDGTLAWTEALPDSDRRRTVALLGVLDQMAEEDPVRAKKYVQSQDHSNKDAPELAAQLVVDLLKDEDTAAHPDHVGQWVLSLPGPGMRRAALTSLVDVWLTKLDVAWTQFADPPRVTVWASSLTASGVRGEVWGVVAAAWGRMRPLAAKDWLRHLPEDRDRDAAMAAYDEAIISAAQKMFAGRHSDQALRWLLMNLLDQKRAAELVEAMLFQWAKKDPAKASEWAKGHGMRMPPAASN